MNETYHGGEKHETWERIQWFKYTKFNSMHQRCVEFFSFDGLSERPQRTQACAEMESPLGSGREHTQNVTSDLMIPQTPVNGLCADHFPLLSTNITIE